MGGTNCHIGCSNSVLFISDIDGDVKTTKYTHKNGMQNGKMIYKSGDSYLYYSTLGWTVSQTIGSTDEADIVMKTASCPQEGGEFVDKDEITGGHVVNVQTLEECIVPCRNRPDCKYWQWNRK